MGDSTDRQLYHARAQICIAFSTDLVHWDWDDVPLYQAGGTHVSGIDSEHAHKVSFLHDANDVECMQYTAMGIKGRGIVLLTSRPVA